MKEKNKKEITKKTKNDSFRNLWNLYCGYQSERPTEFFTINRKSLINLLLQKKFCRASWLWCWIVPSKTAVCFCHSFIFLSTFSFKRHINHLIFPFFFPSYLFWVYYLIDSFKIKKINFKILFIFFFFCIALPNCFFFDRTYTSTWFSCLLF